MLKTAAVILVILGIIAGAVIFGKDADVAGTPSNNIYGLTESTVTLTEYGDFECPACAAFYPIVAQIKEQYKDQITFEYKHFPLVQIHPNATAAHRAAEAAGKQGKFWEMHDLLYEQQASWRSSGAVDQNGLQITNNNPSLIFEQYAESIGLDMDRFKADVKASETLATINADIELGKEAGASGTPTFVLNGKVITETSSIDTVSKFSALIEQALAETTDSQPDAETP